MIEINKTYRFKEEFCAELSIPANQYDRKQQELLAWLTNFFDYEFYEGRPKRIRVTEIYGEYQPLPRKTPKQDALNLAKEKDYTNYTIAALGTEFKPNSKSKVARDAIRAFGESRYHHTNTEAVAKRFIKKPFDTYGETNGQWYWVWYSTYEPLDKNSENRWRDILREEEIAETEAANAFYKMAEGENVDLEINRYKRAQECMKEEYGDFPVRVREWRKKIVED